jgi:hypothetical protein
VKVSLIVRVVFDPPLGEPLVNPPLESLHVLVVDPPAGYWDQGGGGGNLDWFSGGTKTSLMLIPDSRFGFSLRYYDEQEDPWLSVEDHRRFSEWAEWNDEWYVSVALFVPKEKAWLAVKEFCLTGRMSPDIKWMLASEIPDDGNW